jgi:hypothetical protein
LPSSEIKPKAHDVDQFLRADRVGYCHDLQRCLYSAHVPGRQCGVDDPFAGGAVR